MALPDFATFRPSGALASTRAQGHHRRAVGVFRTYPPSSVIAAVGLGVVVFVVGVSAAVALAVGILLGMVARWLDTFGVT